MIAVTEFPFFRTKILQAKSLHVFGLGFEQRCLSYPTLLRQMNPSPSQVFRCLNPMASNLIWPLRTKHDEHWAALSKQLPNTQLCTQDQLAVELKKQQPTSICLDVSSLARFEIFALMDTVLQNTGSSRIYAVYTYPKIYAYGSLQEPAHDVKFRFNESLPQHRRVSVIILPGFDVEYANIALTFLKAATAVEPNVKWLFSYPGEKYHFYDRAIEAHLDIMGNSKETLIKLSPFHNRSS